MSGSVSISPGGTSKPVSILRDTGAAHSFIHKNVLPLATDTYTGTDILVRGIELGCIKVPVHSVFLKSELVTGLVNVGVCVKLPVEGVNFILGNDLAGGNVFPFPLVSECPTRDSAELAVSPPLFPACAITRSQSQKFADTVDLSDSFLLSSKPTELSLSVNDNVLETNSDVFNQGQTVTIGGKQLSTAQKSDSTLSHCIESAVKTKDKLAHVRMGYYWDGDVLRRKWLPISGDKTDLNHVYQIVVPTCYRPVVLELAHDHLMAGHFGVN